jgi:hypothetical protein
MFVRIIRRRSLITVSFCLIFNGCGGDVMDGNAPLSYSDITSTDSPFSNSDAQEADTSSAPADSVEQLADSQTVTDTGDQNADIMSDTAAQPDVEEQLNDIVAPGDTASEDIEVPMDDSASQQEDTNDSAALNDTEALQESDTATTEEPDITIPEPPYGQIIPISNGSGYEGGELLGMDVDDNDRVYVFWRGKQPDGSEDLLVSSSDELVTTFTAPTIVKSELLPQGVAVGGDMAHFNDTFYFVWRDLDPEGNDIVNFRKETSLDIQGTDTLIAAGDSSTALWRPHFIAKNEQVLCIIWEQKVGALYDIFLRCSQDAATTWDTAVQVDTPSNISATLTSGTFSADGQLVVAIQRKGPGNTQNIAVQRSNDYGLTWTYATDVGGTATADGIISQSLTSAPNLQPSILTTMTGNLKLAWHSPLPGATAEAYLSSSTDGLSWSTPSLLPQAKANIELVRGRGSDLHASSVESILGQGDTLYMSSTDEGTNWGNPVQIPKTPGSTLIDHKMRGNLVNGWLHIAWWESIPGSLLVQELKLVSVASP